MHSSNADPFDYQILNLTSKFYNTYLDPPYSEIIRKNTRPYNCLLIIKKDVLTYITDYIEYIQGRSNKYDEKSFQRAYGFSTLKYFHRELGIDD